MGLGVLIGAERLLVHKEAGMKTHALVSMGAAVFILISEAVGERYAGLPGFNPVMMAAQVVIGIGFIGAGAIMFQGSHLTGLTTAGGLWVTAGIGMAAGFGFFALAVFATIFSLIVLTAMNFLEKPIKKISNDIGQP